MKEWYLINNTHPSILGGFENDYHVDFKETAFLETLETDIAETLILYNYDLSKSKKIRGIVQGNTADTYLKSMERSILVPIGTLHSGDYIFFEDEYWIVDGRPGNNKSYEKATLKECQYKLRWQKDDGTIVERWANLTSASKYDVGYTGNNVIMLSSNNYTIIIPNDKDSMTIDGKRVFIDLSRIPTKVFKITRNDDVLFSHGKHGGTLNLIADKVELNLETDSPDLRLCYYKEPSSTSLISSFTSSDDSSSLIPSITFTGKQDLKIGGTFKTLIGSFTDSNGDIASNIGVWEVVTIDELYPYIDYSVSDNTMKIRVLVNDFATTGKVRVKFSNARKTTSAYLDFSITSAI